MKLRVLYDFTAQPDTSELTIFQGEILTLLNQDVGEGWWEGSNSRGERGLFPAGYVETYDESTKQTEADQQSNTPVAPPPPNQYHHHHQQILQPEKSHIPSPSAVSGPGPGTTAVIQPEEPDWPEDEFDDDSDDDWNAQPGQPAFSQAPYYSAASSQQMASSGGGEPKFLSASGNQIALPASSPADSSPLAGDAITNAKATRININRFSNFVKSGLECYVLDGKTLQVPVENRVHIQSDDSGGIIWRPNLNQYTCSVAKHGKETKMKGFKTFYSYDIAPSTSNISVRRRYKHFDWLMQRLEQKFIFTPLPPLPEKQIAGRFQEDFVDHRRNLLQLWVNYITRHPVLSQCDVWWHFMTCKTDDLKGWKLGKRKAEKDELVGANFLFSVEIQPNTMPLESVKTLKQLENFQRFVVKLDEAVKHMYNTAVDQSKKYSTIYSKDVKKLSESIKELSLAFQSGTAWRNSLGLNEAIRQTSAAYESISRLYEEQPKSDFEPMADMLHQYKGLLAGWPEILQLHKNTMNTRKEKEQLYDEAKIKDSVMARVNQRASVTTYVTLAEIDHFHNERLNDFKTTMQSFLTSQIDFYSDIVSKLQVALKTINDS